MPLFSDACYLCSNHRPALEGKLLVANMLENERQTRNRLARYKIFREKYGDNWQEMINMEQDPATVSTEQLREVFDMVDSDHGGTLDR